MIAVGEESHGPRAREFIEVGPGRRTGASDLHGREQNAGKRADDDRACNGTIGLTADRQKGGRDGDRRNQRIGAFEGAVRVERQRKPRRAHPKYLVTPIRDFTPWKRLPQAGRKGRELHQHQNERGGGKSRKDPGRSPERLAAFRNGGPGDEKDAEEVQYRARPEGLAAPAGEQAEHEKDGGDECARAAAPSKQLSFPDGARASRSRSGPCRSGHICRHNHRCRAPPSTWSTSRRECWRRPTAGD